MDKFYKVSLCHSIIVKAPEEATALQNAKSLLGELEYCSHRIERLSPDRMYAHGIEPDSEYNIETGCFE